LNQAGYRKYEQGYKRFPHHVSSVGTMSLPRIRHFFPQDYSAIERRSLSTDREPKLIDHRQHKYLLGSSSDRRIKTSVVGNISRRIVTLPRELMWNDQVFCNDHESIQIDLLPRPRSGSTTEQATVPCRPGSHNRARGEHHGGYSMPLRLYGSFIQMLILMPPPSRVKA